MKKITVLRWVKDWDLFFFFATFQKACHIFLGVGGKIPSVGFFSGHHGRTSWKGSSILTTSGGWFL